MLFSTTIPIKELILDYNIELITKSILNIPILTNCKLLKNDTIIKKIDLQFTSLLSMGNKLSIQIIEIDENKTKLIIEITRMVGTFNEAHEVSQANTDYQKFLNALSQSIENPDMSSDDIKNYKSKNGDSVIVSTILISIFVIITFIILF